VLIAPIVSYAAAMLFIVVMLRPLLHLIRFSRLFSNPPIAGVSTRDFRALTLLF
jgi:hypothetical protein